MPLLHEGPDRKLRANVGLAILLASVAGSVNATGFLLLSGTTTAHMSGNATLLGEALGTGQYGVAAMAFRLIVAFVLGAATTAVLLELTLGLTRARFVPTLMLEVLVLAGVAYAFATTEPPYPPLLGQALAFAMGMQNALVTQISGAVVRTTHVTGVLTDLGLEFVHWLRYWRVHIGSRGAAGILPALRGLFSAAEFGRFWLHVSIAVSFTGGAAAGAWLLSHVGAGSLSLPCVILLGLLIHRLVRVRRLPG
ncbi:MAG TPA: YoaK family protein [Myxococcaceae bacterium]|nr:YoaK family protein [Myxococcaceae bacterium]